MVYLVGDACGDINAWGMFYGVLDAVVVECTLFAKFVTVLLGDEV